MGRDRGLCPQRVLSHLLTSPRTPPPEPSAEAFLSSCHIQAQSASPPLSSLCCPLGALHLGVGGVLLPVPHHTTSWGQAHIQFSAWRLPPREGANGPEQAQACLTSHHWPQTRRVVTPLSNSGLLAGEVSHGTDCAASEHRTRAAPPPAWEVEAGCPPQHKARPGGTPATPGFFKDWPMCASSRKGAW